MNAHNLFQQKDGQFVPTRVWACQCGVVSQTQSEAEAHCVPRLCQCGKPLNPHFGICNDCLDAQRAVQEIQRETNRYAAAQKITDWDGPVFLDGADGSGYFSDLGEFLDWCKDEQQRPTYVWACHVRPTVQCDAQDMIEGIEWPEGQEDAELEGRSELDAAVQAFNQLNSCHKSWEPDYQRVVVLTWPEETA